MSGLFYGQGAHFGSLALLLAGLWAISRVPGFHDGEYLGLGTGTWVLLTVADAVIHQVFVWICWRLELEGRRLTRLLGRAAFPAYAAVFTLLIVARPILITCLAISNAGTLPLNRTVGLGLSLIVAIPAAYTFYSVKRYFGFRRAYGIDHFDESYRSTPLVEQGIFRFTANAMYTWGLLALWIPGLALQSVAAVAAAAFSHIYIWVHYFCTEKPDMERIYSATG